MKGNDFRASGSGIIDRQLLPDDAIKIALDLKEKWNTTLLAVDFVDTSFFAVQKNIIKCF